MTFYQPGTKLRKRLSVASISQRFESAAGLFDLGNRESQESNDGNEARQLLAIAVRPMSVELKAEP